MSLVFDISDSSRGFSYIFFLALRAIGRPGVSKRARGGAGS